jgi:hypothetical protein
MLRGRGVDRQRAWKWAAQVAVEKDCWRIESLKHHLERAEALPSTMLDPDLVYTDRKRSRLQFLVGTMISFLVLTVWLIGLRGVSTLPAGSRRIVALHGELSTRTRHVLDALVTADPPVDAIVLLGRLRRSPVRVSRLWIDAGFCSLPPMVIPCSIRAVFAAIGDMPMLWHGGWRVAGSSLGSVLGWRDWASICFRVWHGAIMARWWSMQPGTKGSQVVFGCSGTADTVLLERSIKATDGLSVHAVHGQSVGPIFLGFSDVALFRSRHDAIQMNRSSGYGRCSCQVASFATPRRGQNGVFLLSNLAHPMNPDFRRDGPTHELAVLAAVSGAASKLGSAALPLLWKPHPVISNLPAQQAKALRAQAAAMGFRELPSGASAAEVAGNSLWVVATPSTVALDLLQTGVLSVMIDPRGTLLDSALAILPRSACSVEELAHVLASLRDPSAYATHANAAFNEIGPARPLELTKHFI